MTTEDGIKRALQYWREAEDPLGKETERYLRSRKFPLPDDLVGRVVRQHPALFFDGALGPTMLTLFRDIETNEPCGIERTFLDSRGLRLGRKMLGRIGGAAIKLDEDRSVTQGLNIGEGFATCLAARLFGFGPSWALGSANGIAAFPVLPGVGAVSINGENNDHGTNQRATAACAARWHAAGREVLAIRPVRHDDLADVWFEVTP